MKKKWVGKMEIKISEKQIIEGIEIVLPSIIKDIVSSSDIVENVFNSTVETTVKKIVESGKLDKEIETELIRFIRNDWNSSDMSAILIARISDKLVLKGD